MALMKGGIIFIVQMIGCLGLPSDRQNRTVNGTLGQSVTLPCTINKEMQLDEYKMRVYWQRLDGHNSLVIKMYNNGVMDEKHENISYKQKAVVIPEEIKKGNFNLTLHGVEDSDQGTYQTVFMYDNKKLLECTNLLHVGADFSKPNMSTDTCVMTRKMVKVSCQAGGGFPQPSIQWRSNSDLYSEKVKNEISLNNKTYMVVSHLMVNSSGGQNFTCSVFNPTLGTTQENSISIPACRIPEPPLLQRSALVTAIVVIVVVVAAILVIVCKKRNTNREHQRGGERAVAVGSDLEIQMLQGGTIAENSGLCDIKIV